MTQMPATSSGAGFASAGIPQFSVFLENRVGRLIELVTSFDEALIRICALSVVDSSDHAVIRLITSDANATRQMLTRHDLTFMESDVLVVCLDQTHTMARMCQFLLGAELNIRFAYPILAAEHAPPTLALAVDDLTLAAQILRRKEFRLMAENELPKWGE